MKPQAALIYLVLQIVFSSLFTIVIKYAQSREQDDVVTVGCINYISAALIILPFWIFNNETGATSEQFLNAMYTGGSMGAVYFTAFFFVIYAIFWVGASATTVVGVLSILMPITFAAFFWEDKPNATQITGILLALAALILIGVKPKQQTTPVNKLSGADEVANASKQSSEFVMPWFAPLVLFGFFFLCGLSRMAQEAFKYLSVAGERPTYLLAAFTVAGIPSSLLLTYLWIVKKRKPAISELMLGLMLGAANILQTHFILQSLEHFAGFIVFPVTSAGAIVLTTLIVTRYFGEQLTKRAYTGIVIAVVALFMLHWLPG